MKKIIYYIAHNRYLQLFLGGVTFCIGLGEAWATIVDDFSTLSLHSGHGLMMVGIWHLCQSISEFVEASDELNEAM